MAMLGKFIFLLALGLAGSASGQVIALGFYERKPFKVLIAFSIFILLCVSVWFLPIFE